MWYYENWKGVEYLMSDGFEKTFSDFLDSSEYDMAEEALFSMIRRAYIAGWKAAGGDVDTAEEKTKSDS